MVAILHYWHRRLGTGIGEQLTQLLGVQAELKHRIRDAGIKADSAMRLVDFALAKPIFTARRMERRLGVTYTRANSLVGQLEEIGVLHQRERKRPREYAAPDLLAILVREPY